jgi:hypothetical protein
MLKFTISDDDGARHGADSFSAASAVKQSSNVISSDILNPMMQNCFGSEGRF